MRILIVEDDKVLSLLLTRMCENLACEVVGTSTTGQGAIDNTESLSPDLILMDIMLEDNIDGISAMEKIREFNPGVPVIFITGNSDSYNKQRAEAVSYIDYLIKPVSFEELSESFSKIKES